MWIGGRYSEAADAYRQSYEQAMGKGDYECAAWYLNGRGAALLASFAYRDAMRAFWDARQLAERLGDRETSGVVSLNLASLYLVMGDLAAATVEADRAVDALKTAPESVYHAEALMQLARLKARADGLEAALPLFRAAAQVVDAQGDIALKALVLNQLGFEYLNKGRLNEADRAMTEAFRLRLLSHDRDIGQSHRALGLLRIAQGNLESAEVLLDRALTAGNRRPGRVPNWAEYHARGQLRMAQGRLPEAVRDFRHALALAKQWRLETLPADSIRLSAGVGLAQLYASFIGAAGEFYAETKQPVLAREAFEAAEELRGATLRIANAAGANWRGRLPAEYSQTLEELRAARVRMQREPSRAAREEASRLRLRLTEMEARAGASTSPDDLPDLLKQVSRALAPSEALVSFHLGEPCSYAWTVTRSSFKLRRLAAARKLRELVRDFSAAVRSDAPQSTALGERLYRELFPQNAGDAESKRNWLLAADSTLLDVPFSSLVVGQGRARPVFLIERHSVTLLPAAYLLLTGTGPRNPQEAPGPFLAVGDPIYNTADPRRRESGVRGVPGELPRLAGTDVEIKTCARAWCPNLAPVLLVGRAATRQRLAEALATEPGVIHLAAHVVRSADAPPRPLIQLSLLAGGDPDYLGAEDIASWRLRKPAIVVLSGCASGRAEAHAPIFSTFALPSLPDAVPDSGLAGLAQAWLAAGASAVVVSHWPTPDDTGELFHSFYGHLHTSGGAHVAAALGEAQIEMLKSRTWRSAPGHWAAYFAIGRN